MANNREEYIFDVDAEVSKAVSKLNKIRKMMDEIEKIRNKGADDNYTTNHKDINKNMRIMKQLTYEYKNTLKEIDALKRKLNSSDSADKGGYAEAISKQQQQIRNEYKETLATFRELASFQQSYTKNFQTLFNDKGVLNDPTKNFDAAKQRITDMVAETNKVKNKWDEVANKVREVNKLDRRSESLSRRASASKYMSFQQSSNFKKDLHTVNVGYHREKDDNLTKLTEMSTQMSSLMKQIKSIEENPIATQKDMERKISMQQTIESMDKEWEARVELNRVLERTISNMEKYNSAVQGVTVKPERGTFRGMAYERAPAIGLAMTGVFGGTLGSLYHQGASINKGMRQDEISIGQRIGMDGSQWRDQIRDGALNAGLSNKLGMSGQEMLSFQENYLSKRGYTGLDDLNTAMQNQATFSRVSGVNSEDTKSFFNSVYGAGAVNGKQTKDLQNAFMGAIKKSGMEGREKDQLKALEGILGGMSSNRSLSNQDIMNTLGLQSILSQSGNRSLQGDKGGQLMSSLDEGIRGGFDDPMTRLMFGQGTKYRGLKGRWELRQQMEKGISDVNNVKTLTQIAAGASSDEDVQNEALASTAKGRLGVNMSSQQAKGLMDLYRSGKLDQGNLDKVLKDNASVGDKISKDKMENYKKSSASTDNQSDKTTEKQAAGIYDMGEVVREANSALGGVPPIAYGLIAALGALTLAMAGSALSFGMSRGIRSLASTRFGGRGGTPPTGGGGGVSPGGLVGSSGAGAGVSAGAGTRTYSNPGGVRNTVSGWFDPSVRAGGLPNPGPGVGAGAGVAEGAMAGGSRLGGFFKGAGKVAGKALLPLSILMGVGEVMSAPDDKKGEATGSATGGILGGIAGGAAAGFAAGTVFPGLGNIAGAIIGGAGGLLGAWGGSKLGGGIGSWFDPDKAEAAELTPEEVQANEEKAKAKENSTKEQTDKENTNTRQRTELKKTDNLAYERENLTLYEKVLQRAEQILAQARTQNGIFGNGNGAGGTGAGGGAGISGGGKLKILPQGQKWSNSNLTQHDLGTTDGQLTAADLDKWIDSKAPQGSMMRGMGATFLKAGQENGLDPRYLIAHAAEESAWGTSRIARDKGNFFGIGAFDDSPYSSAFGFKDGKGSAAENGIMGGAKWIADHYYNKGNTTLDKMHKAGYATNSDWASNIANIMQGAPQGTGSVKAEVTVNVKGDEKVSDKLKDNKDMKNLGNVFSNQIYSALGYYSQENKRY